MIICLRGERIPNELFRQHTRLGDIFDDCSNTILSDVKCVFGSCKSTLMPITSGVGDLFLYWGWCFVGTRGEYVLSLKDCAFGLLVGWYQLEQIS